MVTEFKAALAQAEEALKNPTNQAKVDASFDRLAQAMHMLSFIKGDKTELIKLIDKINGLKSQDYTVDSWQSMQSVLEDAHDVVADENALKDEVAKTYDSLVRAFINLRLKPNKDLLEDLINKVEKLNKANYTADSWGALEIALSQAKITLADEKATVEDIMHAESMLRKTVDNLAAVNPVDPNLPVEPVKPGDTNTNKQQSAIKTGDDTSLQALLLAGGAALGAMLISRKKRKED